MEKNTAQFEQQQTLWRNFISSGNNTIFDPFLLRQLFFINVSSFIGFLAAFGIGLANILGANYQVGIPDLLSGIVFLLNIFLLRISQNINSAKAIILATLGCLLLVILATGGTARTGIFWYFIFPIAAFFLTGKKNGIISVLLLCCATALVSLLGTLGYVSLVYSLVEIRQLFLSLFVASILVYVYQYAIEDAENEAKKLDQAKSEFVALASHQLRTPISAISWFTEMILHGDSGPINNEQKEQLLQIYQSNQRMAALVESLLNVSRLETGSLAIKPESIDLAKLSHTILSQELEKRLSLKKLTVEERYDKSLTKIPLDPEVMKVILQNVFSNAIKYTPENGKIIVTILHSRQSRTENGNNKERGILLEVTDTGCGIPKEQQKNIFSKLFRAENARVMETDGTGLGLYIVKSALAAVGGNVWFVSEENKGSTFFVWLPKEGMRERKGNKELLAEKSKE